MNTITEDGPALICIPDITGFTRFMAETKIRIQPENNSATSKKYSNFKLL